MKALRQMLILFLCMLCLLPCFGCSKGQNSNALWVLIDLSDPDGNLEPAAKQLTNLVKQKSGPQDIELEFLPNYGAERKSLLTRIRTEVMAGQGPDVFIVSQQGDDSLFLMPEKSMELGLFMPLDNYLETSQFTDFDRFIPQLLEAGRTEKWGQVLLPMGWSTPLTLFAQDAVDFTHSPEITWQDMLDDGTGVLQAAADWSVNFASGFSAYGRSLSFGQLADFTGDKLCFTEEELLERIQELFALNDKMMDGAFDSLPMFCKVTPGGIHSFMRTGAATFGKDYRTFMESGDFNGMMVSDFLEQVGAKENQAVTMIPVYSDDGGTTATVCSFAAVSANTRRPEDAFFVLDVLFSEEYQRGTGLFCVTDELPVDRELLKPAVTFNGWSLKEAAYAEYCRVQEDITQVNFFGTLQKELYRLVDDCYKVYTGQESGDMAELVHDTYRRMEIELGE